MVQIAYLVEKIQFLETIAQWHHQQWAYMRPEVGLHARTERLRALCGLHDIPSAFVAYEGETPVGSAMLVLHDMDSRKDLSPWLAGVYVHPDWRCRGIGGKLVRRVMDEARELGVEVLYLFTPDKQGFYEELGWQLIERTHYRNIDVSLMHIMLSSQPASNA